MQVRILGSKWHFEIAQQTAVCYGVTFTRRENDAPVSFLGYSGNAALS